MKLEENISLNEYVKSERNLRIWKGKRKKKRKKSKHKKKQI